jgi:hypothetical protein
VELTLLLVAGGVLAGAFGALLGLGGGILIVPLLTLGFGVPFLQAVGVSLLAVITTSSSGTAAYLQRGTANLRLGMTLELATAIGALCGGLIAFLLPERVLFGAFAVMLAYTGYSLVRRGRAEEAPAPEVVDPDPGAGQGGYAATLGGEGYAVRRLPLGLGLSGGAGVVSALLGVGGGVVMVPAMHLLMGVPLRVATATSTLMIGVTASASASLYLLRGHIDPLVAGPVVLGVIAGATGASRVAHRVPVRVLRVLFVVVLGYVALEMAARAVGGGLLRGVSG